MEYMKPEVEDYGTLAELTAGKSTGNYLDAKFDVGTPFDQLSFTNFPLKKK
jgi:hypothetical protein